MRNAQDNFFCRLILQSLGEVDRSITRTGEIRLTIQSGVCVVRDASRRIKRVAWCARIDRILFASARELKIKRMDERHDIVFDQGDRALSIKTSGHLLARKISLHKIICY